MGDSLQSNLTLREAAMKVRTFLLSALTIAALTSPPNAPRAEEPAAEKQESQSLDTITPSDVDAYLNMSFSEKNPGIFVRRNGKIRKLPQPINIHVYWPMCEEEIEKSVTELKENTNIEIHYEHGQGSKVIPKIFIIGVESGKSLYENTGLYESMNKYFFPDKEFLDSRLKKIDVEKIVITQTESDSEDMNNVLLVSHIISEKWISKNECPKVSGLIFSDLSDSAYSQNNKKLSPIDYLFISSLHDSSIQNGEDENTARIKIRTLMLNTIIERKNNHD